MINAIILAAGQGTRLRPLTSDTPKCLVRLFGRTLLDWQIGVLRSCGIRDISVVTGYCSEKIRVPGVDLFANRDYERTNMVESLFCAREKLLDKTVVTYGDIIYQKSVLERLIACAEDISVVVDTQWRPYWQARFDDPMDDAESLRIDEQGYITSIGQKAERIEDITAQYIGLLKFQRGGIETLKSFYDQARRSAALGDNPLRPGVAFEESYMTDLLQGLINTGSKIRAVAVENGWLELDSLKDYRIYNKMKAEGRLNQFFYEEPN